MIDLDGACGVPTRQHKGTFGRRDGLALGTAFSALLAIGVEIIA